MCDICTVKINVKEGYRRCPKDRYQGYCIPVTPYDVADFGQQAFELEGQIRFTEMQLLGRTVDD